MKYPCPICGDPNGYPLWIDKEPPTKCPRRFDYGGELDVRNVTECRGQMEKAKQRAEWRKLVPDAFDEWGNMKEGNLARVLSAWADHHGGSPPPLVI